MATTTVSPFSVGQRVLALWMDSAPSAVKIVAMPEFDPGVVIVEDLDGSGYEYTLTEDDVRPLAA